MAEHQFQFSLALHANVQYLSVKEIPNLTAGAIYQQPLYDLTPDEHTKLKITFAEHQEKLKQAIDDGKVAPINPETLALHRVPHYLRSASRVRVTSGFRNLDFGLRVARAF